jgi:LPS-assembly protein
MKNKIIVLLLGIFLFNPLLAESLNIQSKNISIDKVTKLTIFKDKVVATDDEKNILKTEYAEYEKEQKLLYSKGATTILTSEGFLLTGTNIYFDNNNNLIKSDYPSTIKDLEKNTIFLDKFVYSTNDDIFRSSGKIKVIDSSNNIYHFSQVYIDEKKREIVGTDSKAYLNQKGFKINDGNKPRVFSNTVKINKLEKKFTKSVFTLCDYRENDKCPPWSLQASQMTHDKKKKTIYYDNAVIKFYDIPIFYTPKLAHADPSVDRRSGFLPPTLSDSKNLGASLQIPYFWNLNKDKDFTLTSKLFIAENPLLLGEYRQAFKQSNLILDLGYTDGYKKTSSAKKAGEKSHFFSKFVKNYKGKDDSDNNIELSLQEVSNDKYLKLYKIKTNLVDYNTDTIENSLNFTHENENLFLGIKASSYETLKDTYNDKYEYILPDILLDKNLFASDKYGTADLTSSLKVHNYDTNKFTKFLVNDFDWKHRSFNYPSGLNGRFLGKLKNVNYEAKNTKEYKDEPSQEIYGALGYLTKLDLFKKTNYNEHSFTPKMLFRYAPGNMRKEQDNSRLNNLNIFKLDRLNSYNNFESGLSSTLGFDYEIKNDTKIFTFSGGQVINEKENKDMPSSSSLDEKLSDFVGNTNLKVNDKLEFNYNFALDQNYNELNYNEISTNFDLNPVKFDFSYLQEKKHIGNQEYIKGKFEVAKSQDGVLSFETKRNLVTNSFEYYNLSYEYLNDCLRAGLVYRREFYNDSELEQENSLMFKITLIPFANINTPSFNRK